MFILYWKISFALSKIGNFTNKNIEKIQDSFYSEIRKCHICSFYNTVRLFVRVNHINELYFSMISFQNKANRVYVSEINLVVFKR